MTRQVHKIKLGGELGLRDADELREQLLDALHAHTSVEIDANKLTAIDMSIVQILIAADKMAKGGGRTFWISAQAEGPLASAISRAGLLSRSGQAPFQVSWQGGGAVS